MNKLAEYLSDIYDEDIVIKKVELNNQLPLFLQMAYEFFEGTIQGHFCIFCQPTDDNFSIRSFFKNYNRIMDYSGNRIPVLILDFLKSNERAFLLKNRLPFLIPFKQLYLPFAGMISLLLYFGWACWSLLMDLFSPNELPFELMNIQFTKVHNFFVCFLFMPIKNTYTFMRRQWR